MVEFKDGNEAKGYKKLIVWQKADELAFPIYMETEYLLEFSLRLKYLTQANYDYLESLRQRVGSLLWKYYKSF